MKNFECLYSLLETIGFKLIEKDKSAFFGDYYNIFTNNNCQLRLSSTKSFETIEIRSNQPNEKWYDLALIKALIYNEKWLNKVTTIEENKNFLQNKLTNIFELFDTKNYPETKKSLEELSNKRLKQMFPGIRN